MKIRDLFTAFSICLLILSCQKQSDKVDRKNITTNLEIANSIIVSQFNKDKTEWKLFADSMKKYSNKNETYLFDMKLQIMNQENKISSTIYADSANIDNKKDIISGYGNLKIYTEEGDLFGKSMVWYRNKGKIISNDSVKVIKDNNTIWGNGFHSDDRFEHVILEKASAQGEISDSTQIW